MSVTNYKPNWTLIACLESWKYVSGTVLHENAGAQNEQECLSKCNSDENCKFWDFHETQCRLLGDEGNGPKLGYDGAVGGKKNCEIIKSGPQSKIQYRWLYYFTQNFVFVSNSMIFTYNFHLMN